MNADEYAAEVGRLRRVLVKFVVVVVAVNVAMVGAVWVSSFTGRTAVVHNLRDGCARTRVRIHALAADATRRGADGLAWRLVGTIPASCAAAYPDPGPFALPRG